MKKLAIVASGIGIALSSGLASAADLSTPYYKAPPPILYTWTGFYIGANVGWGWQTEDVTRISPGVAFPAGTQSTRDQNGVIGGGQVGFDYQINQFVIGVVGSFEGSNIAGQTRDVSIVNGDIATHWGRTRWLADVGGRIGYAFGNDYLPYVKGGAAWHRFDSNSQTTTPALVETSATQGGETRSGWFVGGGLEWKPVSWVSLFAEYDYYGWGTDTVSRTVIFANAATIAAGFPVGSQVLSSSSSNTQVVKVGLNLRPDWSTFWRR